MSIGWRGTERGSMHVVGPIAIVFHFALNTSAHRVVYMLDILLKLEVILCSNAVRVFFPERVRFRI
jgi:hypothetical protein